MKMDGTSVAERLGQIEIRIRAACARAARPRESVRLLAVSKFQPLAKIREAFEAGQRDFAENYLQEAFDKQKQLSELPVAWHFVGRIQSNKAKLLANRFQLIHSIERAAVADILNRQSARGPQDILLQFNAAAESAKAGAREEDLMTLLELVAQHTNLRAMGLMVMPPLTPDPEVARPFFAHARETLGRLRGALSNELLTRHPLHELSMGTTQDFEVAIEEGATWIRLGTEIFGSRQDERQEE